KSDCVDSRGRTKAILSPERTGRPLGTGPTAARTSASTSRLAGTWPERARTRIARRPRGCRLPLETGAGPRGRSASGRRLIYLPQLPVEKPGRKDPSPAIFVSGRPAVGEPGDQPIQMVLGELDPRADRLEPSTRVEG